MWASIKHILFLIGILVSSSNAKNPSFDFQDRKVNGESLPGQEVFCNGMGLECVKKEQPDCNYFLNKCSELCNNDVLIAHCS